MCLCVGLLLAAPGYAADGVGPVTGNPLPRFVSIDRDEANLRTGPGKEYPIIAVLQWRNMPVKIIGEYDVWRKVTLYDGSSGWLHRVLLDSRRTFLIRDNPVVVREDPSEEAEAVATFQPGVIATLDHCEPAWCAIQYDRYSGWVPREAGWGLLPGETLE